LLPEELPPGLAGRFGAELGEAGSVLPAPPLMPDEPDELELPDAEVPPPEALSRSHPARNAPERAREIAAANAVTFMFTSRVVVLSGEQVMGRPSSFTKVVLFTDSDGRARFREESVGLTEGSPPTMLSAVLPATGYQLRRSAVGFASSFHCTPKPQWVFILGGEMEIGLQDGSTRLFRAGEHFFSADVLPESAVFDPRVHGHRSAQRGPDPLVTLFLKV
jgi:hypothetical protein